MLGSLYCCESLGDEPKTGYSWKVLYAREWCRDDEPDVGEVGVGGSAKELESEFESDPDRNCPEESMDIAAECLLDVADGGGVIYP